MYTLWKKKYWKNYRMRERVCMSLFKTQFKNFGCILITFLWFYSLLSYFFFSNLAPMHDSYKIEQKKVEYYAFVKYRYLFARTHLKIEQRKHALSYEINFDLDPSINVLIRVTTMCFFLLMHSYVTVFWFEMLRLFHYYVVVAKTHDSKKKNLGDFHQDNIDFRMKRKIGTLDVWRRTRRDVGCRE